MHGRKKLAGLLIDQFGSHAAVVGIGVNLVNQPELLDPDLEGQVARLGELVRPCPAPMEVAVRILQAVRGSVLALHRDGFETLVPAVNLWWRIGVPFEIETADGQWRGRFAGIDQAGRLRLSLFDGEVRVWAAHQVIRASEAEEGI
jgi:biotin-(acetyl-CoA carboxylase) ligase